MIDAITLAALADAGIDPKKAIGDLRESKIRVIDLDTRHGRLILYVRDGVVSGNVPLGDGLNWKDGRLTVPKARGLSLKDVEGKRLDLLVPHEFFDPDLKVSYASDIGDNVWLSISTQPVALKLSEEKKAA